MSVSAVTRPTDPLPGPQHLTFSLSGGGNFLRLWVTSAPVGSSFRKQLDEARDNTGATRVEVYSGSPETPWKPLMEVGGVYTFTAQEYTFGATTHGGSYLGDPNSYPSETTIGSENTVTAYVGQRIEWPLGVSPHTARIAAYVWSDSIQPTTISQHGLKTPAYVSATSPLAEMASLALDAEFSESSFTGAVTTLTGDVFAITTAIREGFDAHLTQSGIHYANDTDNAVGSSYDSPEDWESLATALNRIRRNMVRHMTNDSDGTGAGSAGTAYHQDGSGGKVSDWALPIAPPANPRDPWSCYTLMANLYFTYEAHRIDAVHQASDNINTLSGATGLMSRVHTFLAITVDTTPTVPSTINSGAATAIAHGAIRA